MTDKPDKTDALPAAQYLILDVLAARHRLGDRVWSFPRKFKPILNRLQAAGLVEWRRSSHPDVLQAWLTPAGRDECYLGKHPETPVGPQPEPDLPDVPLTTTGAIVEDGNTLATLRLPFDARKWMKIMTIIAEEWEGRHPGRTMSVGHMRTVTTANLQQVLVVTEEISGE